MKSKMTVMLIASLSLLSGCSETVTGAYEATIVQPNGQSRLAGIAIFKEDEIVADGQSVKVLHWEEKEDVLTAFGPEEVQLFQIKRTGDGEFTQAIPTGSLVFKKYDLPTWGTW